MRKRLRRVYYIAWPLGYSSTETQLRVGDRRGRSVDVRALAGCVLLNERTGESMEVLRRLLPRTLIVKRNCRQRRARRLQDKDALVVIGMAVKGGAA